MGGNLFLDISDRVGVSEVGWWWLIGSEVKVVVVDEMETEAEEARDCDGSRGGVKFGLLLLRLRRHLSLQ